MANTLVVFQNRNPRVFGDKTDQSLSAPGDDDVNIIIQADQGIHSGPFSGGDHLNGLFGNPGFRKRFRQQFT